MTIEFDNLRAAFQRQSAEFLDLVDATPDLAVPTPLDGWDCAVLIGHVSTAIEALWRWRGDPPDGAVELDRVDWWDGVDPTGIDTFAQRYAAKRTHGELRELIASSIDRADQLLAEASSDWTLVAPGGIAWTRLDEALATRTFELTVHGLDLATASCSSGVPDAAALAISGEILDRRLDGPRPTDLEADLDWVRAATGRASHADPRLPVVS
jgi:Mycothiol maleylpyruvate isomerase N-terminal domain